MMDAVSKSSAWLIVAGKPSRRSFLITSPALIPICLARLATVMASSTLTRRFPGLGAAGSTLGDFLQHRPVSVPPVASSIVLGGQLFLGIEFLPPDDLLASASPRGTALAFRRFLFELLRGSDAPLARTFLDFQIFGLHLYPSLPDAAGWPLPLPVPPG